LPAVIAGATEARLVHQDDAGQSDRQLLALAGSAGGGFAALWLDSRDGLPAVYLRCFDSSGRPRAGERPVRERASPVLEHGASVALGPGGRGAVAWSLADGAPGPGVFQIRTFGPGGAFDGPAQLVGSGPKTEVGRTPGELLPSALADAEGRILVAWMYAGRPRVQELGQSMRLLDRFALSEGPEPREGEEPADASPVRWISQSGGGPIAVWGAGAELFSAEITPSSRPRSIGAGRLLAAAANPHAEGGAWLVVENGEQALLRPLDARAKLAGEDIQMFSRPPAQVDLASWAEGLVLVVQEHGALGAGGGGAFKLLFLEADGSTRARAPITVGAEGDVRAIAPRIASAGQSLLVAWSERRGSGLEVRGRLLRAGEAELGPEWPLAEAPATSHQSQPAASSVVDQRAVVVWLDERGGRARPYGRLVSRAGDPLGAEFEVAADADGAATVSGPASDPAVVMGPAGDFLVSWLEPAGLACRVFEPDVRPKGPPALVAPGLDGALGYAVARQESHRSWLLAWREAAGLVVRRVRGDGVPLAQPTAVAGTEQAARPALLELADERVVVAWEEGPRLELRLLHAELHAASEVIEVQLPTRASHREPHLAPAPGGGFLLAWTAELSPTEMVVGARQFDGEGQAVAGPWALSEPAGREEELAVAALGDGSWLFAFSLESLAGRRVAVRRLWPGKEAPEPLRLLDPPVRGYHQASQQPAIAGVEGGWLGLWVDAHRGQGLDVWFLQAGLDFDLN
jgi:hypothetical protein